MEQQTEQQTRITPADFFWNTAAQEAGFSVQFWLDAYNRYLDEVQRDPSPSFDIWEVERTVRVPFGPGHVDVLVRLQPEGREHSTLRFTVFPAADGPDPRQFNRWYWYEHEENEGKEIPPILGEGALLDHVNRW